MIPIDLFYIIPFNAHNNPDRWISYAYVQKSQLRLRELNPQFRSRIW